MSWKPTEDHLAQLVAAAKIVGSIPTGVGKKDGNEPIYAAYNYLRAALEREGYDPDKVTDAKKETLHVTYSVDLPQLMINTPRSGRVRGEIPS